MFLAHLWIFGNLFSVVSNQTCILESQGQGTVMQDTRVKSVCIPNLTGVGKSGSLGVCLNQLLVVIIMLILSTECIQVRESELI